MLLVHASAGPSAIHGLGLFAREFIPNGAKIWEFCNGFDQLLSQVLVESLPEPTRNFVCKVGWKDPVTGWWIYSADDDRFTNHAFPANTAFRADGTYAVRDILEGEEITVDYTEPGWNEFTVPIGQSTTM